ERLVDQRRQHRMDYAGHCSRASTFQGWFFFSLCFSRCSHVLIVTLCPGSSDACSSAFLCVPERDPLRPLRFKSNLNESNSVIYTRYFKSKRDATQRITLQADQATVG